MRFARGLTTISAIILLCVSPINSLAGIAPPLGILPRAVDAQLNSADAYPGLSVFEGESLSTAAEGKLAVRIGAATLALSNGAGAALQKVAKWTAVDLAAGWLYLTSPANAMVEVHAEDAMLRPETGQSTQAEVRFLGLEFLQIHAVHGNLEFYYRDEFQLVSEGETYRIYLDAPAAGLAAWGIHSAVETEGVERPAKP